MEIDAAMPVDLAAHHRRDADTKASSADITAIGIASAAVQRTPHKLTAVNARTMKHAIAGTGTAGQHQALMAVADMMAVTPQVGTQPHQ